MVDYRKFLAGPTHENAPWFGGEFVQLAGRRVRLVGPPPPTLGWFAWEVRGRHARCLGIAPPGSLDGCPSVRGAWCERRLVLEHGSVAPVHFIPDDEPPLFAPVRARRWPSGELLFQEAEFESEIEWLARERLTQGSLFGLKGVPANVRAAFGLTVIETTAKRLRVDLSWGEVRGRLADIAERGPAEAERVLRELEAEREQARREWSQLVRTQREALLNEELHSARERRATHREANTNEAAIRALEQAGATVESIRQAARGEIEVVFRYLDQRFVAVANASTLQVLDSGICLGHPPADKLLTLDSLPAVIQEAYDTDALVILRHP